MSSPLDIKGEVAEKKKERGKLPRGGKRGRQQSARRLTSKNGLLIRKNLQQGTKTSQTRTWEEGGKKLPQEDRLRTA